MNFILEKEFEMMQKRVKGYRKNNLINQLLSVYEVKKYNLKNVEIGIDLDTDEIFSIDFSKSKRIVVIGQTGCFPLRQELLIDNKIIEIGKLKLNEEFNVKSYNFKENKIENDILKIIDSGKKNIFKVETEDGRFVEASNKHIFYVKKGNKFIETMLKDLKANDNIIVSDYMIKTVKIKSIKLIGKEDTRDIMVKKNNNTILPNGIIAHNTGKTTLNSNIIDRCNLGGMSVFSVDLKGEYIYKRQPLQENMKKFLLPDEIPTGMDIQTIYPMFLQKITNYELNTEVEEKLLMFPLNKLNFLDFRNIANISSENANMLIDSITSSGQTFNTFEDFREYVLLSDIASISKTGLINKMKMLIEQKVFIDGDMKPEEEFSIINELSKGKIVNYNQKGIMSFLDIQLAGIACSYLGVILNSIYNAKLLGGLDRKLPLLISMDETSIFVPRNQMTTSKLAFLNLLKLSRSELISIYACAQDWRYMPDDLIRQADFVFFSYKTEVNDLLDFVTNFFPAFYPAGDRKIRQNIMELLSTMKLKKSGARPWLVFNMQTKDWARILPSVPLSALYVEGE